MAGKWLEWLRGRRFRFLAGPHKGKLLRECPTEFLLKCLEVWVKNPAVVPDGALDELRRVLASRGVPNDT